MGQGKAVDVRLVGAFFLLLQESMLAAASLMPRSFTAGESEMSERLLSDKQ